MSTISRGPAAVRGTAERHPWVSRLAATLKRRWVAYISRRLEQAAIAVFCSMSDRELRDIGLTRGDVTRAASGAFSRHDRAAPGREAHSREHQQHQFGVSAADGAPITR